MKETQERIEEIKRELNELSNHLDTCEKEKILKISLQLDELIYEAIK
ncbi:Spo0E family sporulation regulatory protein-aspartic acid phosphatase [Garciella nitratireducens]|nr:Spo0E family sporulation regulatory protein-aspartic acid phosphatase [Garciella nitratireducens]RBP42261.1 Spo0E like sporulation regulatory protein [Garciella nitratireducens]